MAAITPDNPKSPLVHEQRSADALASPPQIAVALAVLGLAAVLIAGGVGQLSTAVRIAAGAVTAAVVLVAPGFLVVLPNESRVLILFGRYVGTLTEARLWWTNPFTVIWRQTISLRVRNFQSERIKVNDASGNPIDIAAVVVWRVVDTAKAVFDVEDFQRFVVVQSETALRHLANSYPYDDYNPDTISLRGNTDEVRQSLQDELQTRLQTAGIEVLETRLTHLAYASEIAEVMLRRQQAEALVAARRTMVQGAVGLVHMALSQLADSDLVELDPERKASMVANLMIVLSGDHSPTPVINTGSLYTWPGAMPESKRFLLRLDPRLFAAIRRWADDDLRSINAQIEYLLTEAARRTGRLPHQRTPPLPDPPEPDEDTEDAAAPRAASDPVAARR